MECSRKGHTTFNYISQEGGSFDLHFNKHYTKLLFILILKISQALPNDHLFTRKTSNLPKSVQFLCYSSNVKHASLFCSSYQMLSQPTKPRCRLLHAHISQFLSHWLILCGSIFICGRVWRWLLSMKYEMTIFCKRTTQRHGNNRQSYKKKYREMVCQWSLDSLARVCDLSIILWERLCGYESSNFISVANQKVLVASRYFKSILGHDYYIEISYSNRK